MPTKILAIDDSKTMRLAIKITFAAEDADVTSVGKGSEAVARAKQMGADVVLVDAALGAGEPSGYDVCQQLKNDAATASTPVILMVSNQGGVDQGKLKSSGVDGWIAKPFDTADLIAKVGEVVGQPVAKAAAAAAPKPAAPPAAAPPKPVAPPPRAATPKPAAPLRAPAPPSAGPAPKPAPRPVPKPIVKPAPAAAAAAPLRSTIAGVPAPARPAPKPAAAPRPAAGGEIPIAIPIPFTSADAPTPGILKRLAASSAGSDLDPKVAEALLSLSREVVESVVWEVVPELAEELIKKRAQSA